MSNKANIQSFDALEQFAIHLKKSREQINQSAGEMRNEILRRQKTIQETLPQQVNKQILHWQEVIKNTKQHSGLRPSSEAKEILQRAKEKLADLEKKKLILQKWKQKLPALLEPHYAQIIKFRSYTDIEIQRASESLLQKLKTLDDYTQIKANKQI
jgi:hypothetical protein